MAEPESMRCWALAYAKAGFRVFPLHTIRNGVCSCGKFPCKNAGKHPWVKGGFKVGTTDANIITNWWIRRPGANIGIATGRESNLVVLDVDGAEGEATLAELERVHGALPVTAVVKTGKGRHLHFSYPKNVFKVPSVARNHLDMRGDGGCVVAPPSKHASGHTYAFDNNVEDLAECPLWLITYANGKVKVENTPLAIPGDASVINRTDRPALTIAPSTPPLYSEAEGARLQSALRFIPAHDRTVWRDVGMGLHWTGWDNAFLIWDCWSRTCLEKYDEADQRRTWDSFDRPYDGSRITLGTIFHMAKEHGWPGYDPRIAGGVPDMLQQKPTQPQDSTDVEINFRTDLGNTQLFVSRYGKNIRYIPEWQKWIVWNDGQWKIDEDGAVMRLVKETVEAIYPAALKLADQQQRTELLKHAIRSQAAARIFAIEELARNEAEVVLSVRKLDADPWLMGVQNGVIDLKSGQFRPARREDYITKRSGVTFNPGAQCPTWNAFLDTVTGHDADLKACLQRVVGYTMTGSVREEVLFVLHGTGNNGKSTFREIVHTILGEYGIAADASLLVERKLPGGQRRRSPALKDAASWLSTKRLRMIC